MKRISTLIAAALAMTACATDKIVDTEGVKSEQMDGFTVTWIRDTPEPKLNPLQLFPAASQELIDSLGVQEGIPASMSSFLIKEGGEAALVDAGLGAEFSMLQAGLALMEVEPQDISYIFITHLHGDHIGGLLAKDTTAAFPDAKLYIARAEYDAWMHMPEENTAQLRMILEQYKDSMVLFEFGDTLPMNVKTIAAVGHTPGHTVYQKGDALMVGDIMHAAALQMADPTINAVYDMDPEQCVATRKEIIKYAKENKLLMCGSHLPDPAMIDYRK